MHWHIANTRRSACPGLASSDLEPVAIGALVNVTLTKLGNLIDPRACQKRKPDHVVHYRAILERTTVGLRRQQGHDSVVRQLLAVGVRLLQIVFTPRVALRLAATNEP